MIMNAGWKGDNNYVATVENAYIRYKSFYKVLQVVIGGRMRSWRLTASMVVYVLRLILVSSLRN